MSSPSLDRQIKRILCVCLGNGDRSPAMAAMLRLFLRSAQHVVEVDSAGCLEDTKVGQPHAAFAVKAVSRFGLDISSRKKRRIHDLDLGSYDLFIVVNDHVGGELTKIAVAKGVDVTGKIHNANIENPYPIIVQARYDEKTFPTIVVEMSNVLRYFEGRFSDVPGKDEPKPLAV